MPKLSKETIQQIPLLFEQLNSRAKVAEALNISVTTVGKYLKMTEEEFNSVLSSKSKIRVEKDKIRVDEEEVKKINELFAKTLNMSEVSRQTGWTASTIKRHLTQENLENLEKELEFFDSLYFYVYKKFGHNTKEYPVSSHNLILMKKYRSQGITYKTQQLVLMYFYEILKNPVIKGKASVGIIPYVIDDAAIYYEKLQLQKNQLTQQIQKQLEQDRKVIKINPRQYFNKKRQQKIIKLDD